MQKRVLCLVWLGMTAFFSTAFAQNGLSGDFSADVVSRSSEGSMQMKLYAAPQKNRMEMAGQTIIIRNDLGVMWILMPSEGMYMEQPIDLKMSRQSVPWGRGEMKRTPLGSESVNGVRAEKSQMAVTEPSGSVSEFYLWSAANEQPIRVQALDNSWQVDYQNYREGTQDPALFEVPAGLQKLAVPGMPAGMMSAMAGGGVGEQQ